MDSATQNEHGVEEHGEKRYSAVTMLPATETKVLPPGRSFNLARAWWVVVAVILLAYAGLLIALYGFGYRAGWVTQVTRFVPVPFGVVGYHPLLLSEFSEDVEALNHFYGQQDATLVPIPTAADIRVIARDNVVRRALLNDLASAHGIWVTNQEVEGALNQVIGEAQSREQVAQNIRTLWDWSLADFRRKVLRSYVQRQRLSEALQKDPVIGRELSGNDPRALDRYLDTLTGSSVHYWYNVTP